MEPLSSFTFQNGVKMSRTAGSLTFLTALTMILAFGEPVKALDGPVRIKVVHTFVGGAAGGAQAATALIRATDGAFYGTTHRGGATDLGTVFKMTAGGLVTVLHTF